MINSLGARISKRRRLIVREPLLGASIATDTADRK